VYKKLAAQRYMRAESEETSVKRIVLDSGRLARTFITKRTRKTKKISHDTVPKTPVEATCVGTKPTPKGKASPQNGVVLISAGLCTSQSRLKVLGPEPRRISSESAALEMLSVAEKEGRTSVLDTLNLPVTTSPRVPLVEEIVGLIRKIIEISPSIDRRKVGLKMNPADKVDPCGDAGTAGIDGSGVYRVSVATAGVAEKRFSTVIK